jgi:threonyl-tRNA synthetase
MRDAPSDADDRLHRVRHSLAHVMAQAVLQLRPGSKLGFGPAIDDGFYYDFILSSPLTADDFPAIEDEMRKIIAADQRFTREDLSIADGLARIDGMGEPYKREYAEDLVQKQGATSLSFYTNGPFLDMCEGPHVDRTIQLPREGFKIRSLAGAYWRGDSKNAQMTRLYAYAYLSKKELDARLREVELAKERDHKKLGHELDIYVIDNEIGPGLALWLPNGTVVRDELEKLAKELEFKAGYVRVATPQISKVGLFYKTGHLPYYKQHMYPFMTMKEAETDEVSEEYVLRPMNCPFHHKVFAARKRSYRELPLRLAEYGQVFRYEDSGAISGLLRVRSMCMNDAHLYVTPDQIKSEFLAVLEMHRKVYEVLGLESYRLRHSTWDPEDPKGKDKYVNDPEAWESSQQLIREAMADGGFQYEEVKGEAAFYGPKIDVQFKTVTGREETASTNQLDFAVPKRLNLTYVDSSGAEVAPYVIHRAPLGTHERFVAFLLEHYGGAFPTWLAPVQVRIVPVTEQFLPYAQQLCAELRAEMVRADVDDSTDRMNKKIREAATQKIPNTLVVGEREQVEATVTLRRLGVKEQTTMPFAEFFAKLRTAIATRAAAFPT